jgi:prepilin-type N-terminal cleavage/methylation domain-containing protein
MTYMKNEGFSLVELMIALALGIFLLGGVSLMYLSARTTANDSEALSRLQENVRFASDYLIRDVRNAGFDDVAELVVAGASQINDRFVAVNQNGSELSIRYAGRGHCAERFNAFEVVENTYFVTDEGELACTGRIWDGASAFGNPETVSLVSGVESVSFETICRNQDPCVSACSTDLNDPCVGVRIGLNFIGLRPMQGGGIDIRSVELVAGLRNSVMKILYNNFIDQNGI